MPGFSGPVETGKPKVERVRVFVSYAEEDIAYLEDDSLLGVLKESRKMRFWSDRDLKGSDLWDEVIKDQIKKSEIALVLVSEHFLGSEYCMNVEIRSFLGMDKPIFPVMLRRCKWRNHEWLNNRQHIPQGDETIEDNYADPEDRTLIFEKIRKDLGEQAEKIRKTRDQKASASSLTPPGEPSKPVDDAGS